MNLEDKCKQMSSFISSLYTLSSGSVSTLQKNLYKDEISRWEKTINFFNVMIKENNLETVQELNVLLEKGILDREEMKTYLLHKAIPAYSIKSVEKAYPSLNKEINELKKYHAQLEYIERNGYLKPFK